MTTIYELYDQGLVATVKPKVGDRSFGLYLEKLGVIATEPMPVNEFEGNNELGRYKSSFMFALDKYYGTKRQVQGVG